MTTGGMLDYETLSGLNRGQMKENYPMQIVQEQ